MRKQIAATLCAAAILGGCATKSVDVQPTYTSPSAYSGLSCSQLASEHKAIAGEVARVSEAQDKQRRKDQIATGVGIAVFWPALIYNAAVGDEKERLSRLKGEYEAIDRAAMAKGCSA